MARFAALEMRKLIYPHIKSDLSFSFLCFLIIFFRFKGIRNTWKSEVRVLENHIAVYLRKKERSEVLQESSYFEFQWEVINPLSIHFFNSLTFCFRLHFCMISSCRISSIPLGGLLSSRSMSVLFAKFKRKLKRCELGLFNLFSTKFVLPATHSIPCSCATLRSRNQSGSRFEL